MSKLSEKIASVFDASNRRIAELEQQLAECQAREKVRIVALEQACDLLSDRLYSTPLDRIYKALALPSDSTALDTMLKAAKREALLEAATVVHNMRGYTYSDISGDLRRMAKELE